MQKQLNSFFLCWVWAIFRSAKNNFLFQVNLKSYNADFLNQLYVINALTATCLYALTDTCFYFVLS